MTKLKFVLDALDGVPDALHSFYIAGEDGKFRLQVEGVVEKVRLDEFRETNLTLRRDHDALASAISAYKGLGEDPAKLSEELAELRKMKQRVADNELVDKKGFTEALDKRTGEMKSTFDSQTKAQQEAINRLTAERDQAQIALKRTKVNNEMTAAAASAGVLPTAIPDVLFRAEMAGWTLNEKGKVILHTDGEVAFGADGASPLSPKEWMEGFVRQNCPHYFARSTGGGSNGSEGAGGVKNPFAKDSLSLTEQGRLIRENPRLAKQLAAQAGRVLDI